MNSVELFAGAGGLAIGMSNAGFQHVAVIERDHDACETFRENQRHHLGSVERWPLFEGDVRSFDYSQISKEVAVVSGGPPCQPFSLGGKHRGQQDKRDMFPEAVRAIRELRPRAFVFENVKGLLRESFSEYFEYIYLQLAYPGHVRRAEESWREHRGRLERHHTSKERRPEYKVLFQLLNAANYGVPQRRERVFFVGFRSDIGARWSFPEPRCSEDSLLRSQWISGEYWERHRIAKRNRCVPSPRQAARVEKLRTMLGDGREAWRTVRDALQGLPDPERGMSDSIPNHVYNPGAKAYPGHTGSPLDEPAKTLKAGDHGVPGGENMLARPDGSVRYFTVREAARLQTFPDGYTFRGPWTEAMRQLGNAVPVLLGEVVARSVAAALRTVASGAAERPK